MQVDPYIVSIEAHSGQVALYKFNGGKQDWEKTQVEGTLFVYRREASPQYGFTIMNRFSEEYFINFHLLTEMYSGLTWTTWWNP